MGRYRGIVCGIIPSVLVVLDTNVLVAALWSGTGASFVLLSALDSRELEIAVSVPVVLEYEEILLRRRGDLELSLLEIGTILDRLCSVAKLQEVWYNWRPCLRDPDDDMLLELAVNAGCEAIVTFNTKDFVGAEKFAIEILQPGEALQRLRGRT